MLWWQLLDDTEVSLCDELPAACFVKAELLQSIFDIQVGGRETTAALEKLIFEFLPPRWQRTPAWWEAALGRVYNGSNPQVWRRPCHCAEHAATCSLFV